MFVVKWPFFFGRGPLFLGAIYQQHFCYRGPGRGWAGFSGGRKAAGISRSKTQEESIPREQGERRDCFPLPLRRWILFLEAGFEKLFRICDRIDETDSRFSPSRPSICFRGKGLMQKTFFLLSMRLFFYSQLSYFLLRRPRKNTAAGTDSVRPRLRAPVGRLLS